MSISQDNLNALSTFAAVAEEYCALIDSLREGRPSGFYQTLEAILSRLHMAILPVEEEMARKEHREFEKLQMTQDQWSDLAKLLGEIVATESAGLFE